MNPKHVIAMQEWEKQGLHFGQIATKLRDMFHLNNERAQDIVENWLRARCRSVADQLEPELG